MPTDISPEAAQAFNQANAAFKAGSWAEALEGTEVALKASPRLSVAAILRARTLANLNRLSDASAAFAEALKLEPESFSAWLERGNTLRRLGDDSEAIACYERAVQITPGDRRGHIALSRILSERGTDADRNKAAAHYHLALTASADDSAAQADTHHRIGQYRLETGDVPGALEALRAAQSLLTGAQTMPEHFKFAVQIDLADTLLRIGLTDLAASTMQAASRLTTKPSFAVSPTSPTVSISGRKHSAFWSAMPASAPIAVPPNSPSQTSRPRPGSWKKPSQPSPAPKP